MPDLVTLRAPTGTDLTNHATTAYRVDNGGYVRVPRDAVGPILHNAGFYEMPIDTAETATMGFVRMRHPGGPGATFGYDGVAYEADADAVVHIPSQGVLDAYSHGLLDGDEPDTKRDARDDRIAELEAQVVGLEAQVVELTAPADLPAAKAKAKG